MTYALYPTVAPKFLMGKAEEEKLCPKIEDPVEEDAIPTDYTVDVDGDIFEVRILPTGFVNPDSDGDTPVVYEEGIVFTSMQGNIINLSVEVGDKVTAGTPICVLEAMKMENNIEADHDGVVTDILVEPGDSVAVGDGLMVIKDE